MELGEEGVTFSIFITKKAVLLEMCTPLARSYMKKLQRRIYKQNLQQLLRKTVHYFKGNNE